MRPAVEGVAKASYTYLDNLYVFHHVGGQNNKSGQSNESGGQNNASRTEISRQCSHAVRAPVNPQGFGVCGIKSFNQQ